MRVGTLCSGIGGADLGWALGGHEVVLQAECDPYRRAVLARRFPQAIRFDDAATVTGRVDLVYSELPRGLEVWPLVLAGVRRLAPPWVIIEHSPAHPFGRLVRDLVGDGYDIQVLHASMVLRTPSLPDADWDTRKRAFLIAGPEADLKAIDLKAALVDLVSSLGPLTALPQTVEFEEQSRALPAGWSCGCGRAECGCGRERRLFAVREATSPVLTVLLSDILNGAWGRVEASGGHYQRVLV